LAESTPSDPRLAAGVSAASSDVVAPPVVESTYQAPGSGETGSAVGGVPSVGAPGSVGVSGNLQEIPGGAPGLPSMPGMPGIPGMGMPGMAGMPGMPGMPPGMPGMNPMGSHGPQAERIGGITHGNIYIPPKDEGKMFIGGLNWETTDESMKNYFSQFGEVLDCTVMRDNATGRSRGFGFLTFKDPHCVTMVVDKAEHYLDGKLIDPKRAIPREEQDKTAKIFVGGVGGDVTEHDFKSFFDQYGTVIDAQLMIDKDTGRPRGFGFVTFDSDQAVERIVVEKFLILKGKPIEVKRAEPRTKGSDSREQEIYRSQMNNNAAYMNGMNPAMMSQYYQRWQMYMAQMQQQMISGQMNPAMMQQMQQQMNPAMMAQGGSSPSLPQQQQQPYESPSNEEDDSEGNQQSGVPTGPKEMRDEEDDRRGGDDGQEYSDRGHSFSRYRDRNFGSRVSRDRDGRDGRGDRNDDRRRSRSPIPRGPRGMRGGGNYYKGGRNGRGGGGYHPYHRNN
jgi:RNA-binding protein Musashi